MSEEITALRADVARLTDAVDYLVRRQRALDELKDDLAPIAGEAFQVLTVELARMDGDFTVEDLIELGRKLVRNTRNLSRAVDQLNSAVDLMDDLAPLGTEVFHVAVTRLEELERDGRMDALRRAATTLTRPQVLELASDAVEVLGAEHPTVGPLALLSHMRDPEVQAGLGVMFALLKHLGRSARNLPATA